jgi:cytochrome c556
MSNRLLAVAVALVAGAVGLVQAPALARDGGLDAAGVIKARQASFHLSAGAFGPMKAAIDSGADVNTLAFGARGLARWARTIPSMFPAGTGAEAGVPTKAKPEIWSDRAVFETRAAEYAAAADRLAELAQANDKAGFAAQWAVVRQSCSNCHDAFRAS